MSTARGGDLFPRLPEDSRGRLESLLDTIDDIFPLPARFRAGLGRDVADLSRSLTDRRSERDDGYLGKPAALSAYLRYFLPWNVYRLARLLPALPLDLADGDAVTDLGSGPLTLPIALWLSRPELRAVKLEFRCLDRTGKVLEEGRTLFAALTAGTDTPWKIRTIRGSLGTRIEGGKAAVVTAVNVLNELFWDDRTPVAEQAERKAGFLSALARDDGKVLVVEPGIPRSGEFIAALRAAFIDAGRDPLAPCTHASACPMPGGHRGAKWCHFAFDTDQAPARLHKLSAAAGIPKERATLSFLLAGPAGSAATASGAAQEAAAEGAPAAKRAPRAGVRLPVRVISDAFPLAEGGAGRYACAEPGLILVAGRRNAVEALPSGALVEFAAPGSRPRQDPKSGAAVLELPEHPPRG